MTDSKFSEMLTRIYAAFGKNAPSETSPVYTFLFKRVSFIEDRYCDGIASALEAYDKAPTNTGLAILNEYNKLKPQTDYKKPICQHCHNNSGYIYFVHPVYAAPFGYVAKCPHCNGGNEAEIMYQIKQGSKVVPSEKSLTGFWKECFGEWVPPAERANKQDRQPADTPPADNSPIAGHFKAISQVAGNFNPGSQVVDNLDGISQVAGNFNPGSQVVDNLDNLSQIVDNLGDALDDLWAEA